MDKFLIGSPSKKTQVDNFVQVRCSFAGAPDRVLELAGNTTIAQLKERLLAHNEPTGAVFNSRNTRRVKAEDTLGMFAVKGKAAFTIR